MSQGSEQTSESYSPNGGQLIRAKIELPEAKGGLNDLNDAEHQELLEYLVSRLTSGHRTRPTRLTRYARIDRLISTWQRLSPEDSLREQTEDNTGRQQAIAINLPILSAHLEDTVAFFGEIFSSQSKNFYSVPPENESKAAKALADRMNADTKARKYYKELCSGLRSLVKYNIGGYAVRWEEGGGYGELAKPGNRIESIDMYNYSWDPSILDAAKIAGEAEWAARFTLRNRMWLQRKALKKQLERVDRVLRDGERGYGSNSGFTKAKYWRHPPTYVGLNSDGSDSKTSKGSGNVDWQAYGASLEGDEHPDIEGFEITEMYCWLNPAQFGLKVATSQSTVAEAYQEGTDAKGNSYSLWRFLICDCSQIIFAQQIESKDQMAPEIPHYIGYLTVDDTKEAQRSIMELLKPFQRFASFLMNIYVSGARKNIWGAVGVDPTMFDTSKLMQGDVASVMHSKIAGRDVRTGMTKLDSSTGVEKIPEMLKMVFDIVEKLFPSQALPSQIAGIDRAVKNQVAAVMQGVARRLHMVAKIVDADIMAGLRMACYRNLAAGDNSDLQGLDEEIVATVLGSGIAQLNRESTASEIKEIIYAVLQNPAAATVFDLVKLMTYWSRLMDSPSDLGEFIKAQAPVANVPVGPDGQPIAPDVLAASGLNGAAPLQVPAVG
jgi:hypothetical protein